MTEMLARETCVPCRGGIPPLSLDEAKRYLEQTPGWALQDDGTRLERTFWFANFRGALDFAHAVGELAEAEFHHPDIAFSWGRATISLRTNKINGLHRNDFIMAAKIDHIARAHDAQYSRPERRKAAEAAMAGDTRPSGGSTAGQQFT